MPATRIDPNTALLVIDLQKGVVGLPLAHPVVDVVARTCDLLEAFRAARQTVVLVNTDGAPKGRTDAGRPGIAFPDDWTELLAELQAQATDIRVTKRSWSAFEQTALEATLRSRGVTQIVLAGIATSMGVESTARDAHAKNFHVTLASDAMTDLTTSAHEHSIATIFPRLGEVALGNDIVSLVEHARP